MDLTNLARALDARITKELAYKAAARRVSDADVALAAAWSEVAAARKEVEQQTQAIVDNGEGAFA